MPNLFSRFLGRTASEGAAFAFGVATAPVLHPAVRELENLAWAQYKSKPLDAGAAAGIVAEDVELQKWGEDEASLTGISKPRFDALLGEALNAPDIGELYQLWRRGEIDDTKFAHGLRKAKLEPDWDKPLKALHDVLLSPDTLANARQQGFVTTDRQRSESALQGVTQDRADILFELSGNPPGPETLQRALNRKVIDKATFDQAIREGRTKTKYTGFYETMSRAILSASTYVTAHLKGHATEAEMHAGGAMWGYTPEDLDLWYQTEGNPATPHQIHIGYARGAKLPGAANERDAIAKSVAQGRTRPEYTDLLYAGRDTYPPLFQLSRLVQATAISADTAADWLKKTGAAQEVVDVLRTYWSTLSPTAVADSHIAKAQNQLWTAAHSSYLNREASVTVARTKLAQAGVANAAISTVLGIWDNERELIRKGLTPANVKKAFAKGSRNNATGQPWTRDEAIAFLVGLGWSANEANDYLDIP